jgi:hypothetical protein
MSPNAAFVPEWLNEEVSAALLQLNGEHSAKKEATVLRLAEASASGESWTAVFARPDTCSKRVWYGGGDKAGWQTDPIIQQALRVATARARWWVRVKRGQAVQDALDTLVEGSEDAARQLINLVRHGAVLFGEPGAETGGQRRLEAEVKEVLAAAKEVLDRVSALTATKQQAGLTLSSDQFSGLMQQAQQRAALLEAAAEQGWTQERSAQSAAL